MANQTTPAIQVKDSNVGISATNPLRKLHVVGDFAVNAGTSQYYGVHITGGEGSNPNILIGDWHNASANLTWDSTNRLLRIDSQYSTSGAPIAFSGNDGAIEYMRITAAGNVGIGTTSPSYKLDVQGNSGLVTINTNGSLSAGGQFISGIGEFVSSSSGTDVNFRAGATHLMVLKTSGNVGIGTTSPAYKLEVNGSFGTVTSGIYLEYNSGILYHAGGSGNYYQYISGANYLLSNRTATGALVFSTVDTERMRITSAGNVGIGTTSPSTQLNVMTATNAVDVLRLDNSGGNSGSVQGVTHLAINHFGTGTNPSTRITAYQDSTSGWPGGMYFSTRSLNTDSAPVERMRISSAGNVGIGTSSPQYMLDVNGDAQINAEGTGPAYAYVPDGGFGVDSLLTSSTENVALGKPDVWLRIHVDGVAFVFPGYQEP